MSLSPSSSSRRTLRVALASLAVALVAAAAPHAATAAPAVVEPQLMVVQYVGNTQGNELGKKVMLVAVRDCISKQQMVLAVGNKDAKKADYNPDPKVADPIKELKPDDYIEILVKPAANKSQKPSLTSVKPYKPKTGELEPNVYIFQISSEMEEGGKRFIGVVLMKLGETVTAQVPLIRNEAGGSQPDEKMIASFDAFSGKKDVAVEVTFATKGKNPVIATIDPYAAPEAATFVKATEVEVDGQKADAVELTVGGKPVTAILTGRMMGKKWATDQKLASGVKRLKPEQAIEARLVKDGDKTWLRYFNLEGKEAGAGSEKK